MVPASENMGAANSRAVLMYSYGPDENRGRQRGRARYAVRESRAPSDTHHRRPVRGYETFGSLDRFKAAKGLFVTTSDFTKDARETAGQLSKRIVLIGGDQLAALMVRYDVGCRAEETLYVKTVDEDFFPD